MLAKTLAILGTTYLGYWVLSSVIESLLKIIIAVIVLWVLYPSIRNTAVFERIVLFLNMTKGKRVRVKTWTEWVWSKVTRQDIKTGQECGVITKKGTPCKKIGFCPYHGSLHDLLDLKIDFNLPEFEGKQQ